MPLAWQSQHPQNALTAQRSHVRLRAGRLLIVELQPHSPHKTPVHLRQLNFLVYEGVILTRELECLGSAGNTD